MRFFIQQQQQQAKIFVLVYLWKSHVFSSSKAFNIEKRIPVSGYLQLLQACWIWMLEAMDVKNWCTVVYLKSTGHYLLS